MDAPQLSHCDTDSVRLPGAIQPHGALLVLDGESGRIEAVSESCGALLGMRPAEILGQQIALVLPSLTLERLRRGLGPDLQPLIPLSRPGHELRVRAHLNAASQLLVDIEPAGEDFTSVHGTVYERRRIFAALRRLPEKPAIARAACELIRDLTGFDRVLVYRFDPDWNGEVIGEACAADVEPYLGLWYPASDIPIPARELALTAHVRHIPDALYAPSALIARGTAQAIDLGASSLRSVAGSHVTYLNNMGVRATLVGSLLVHGALWGLMTCHHQRGPKYIGPSVRDAVEWLCEDLSALIQATQTAQRRARALTLSLRRRDLADRLRQLDFKELMQQPDGSALLEVVAADGFALLEVDSANTLGSTPSVARIRELQRCRRAHDGASTLYATGSLAWDMALEDAADGVAGALFVSLRERPDCTLIWFRNERRLPVYWGGDMERARQLDASGRMVPRTSFARFLQEIRGRSLPWSVEELESAAELGSLIDITDRKAAEAELEKYRHHLEGLVEERTAALTLANEAAELAHRASEERLRADSEAKMQSGKLEAVGTLAAGIAHDFNNILGSMIGFAEMTADELPPESRGGRNIAQILAAGFRARDLISRMLTFARAGPAQLVMVDIVEQVQEALALLRASLAPSIELLFNDDLHGARATLNADPTHIMQIVMNLCINAAHAMDNRGPIRIDVRAACQVPDAPPEYAGGICLSVGDRGSGMTPEIIQRIFDPFFTTKAPGAGSGLGLSVIHGIVSGLGGVIRVHSRVDAGNSGTQFMLFLPLSRSLPIGETHVACAID